MAAQHQKIAYLTELRALSCMAIVFLHTFYAASAYSPGLAEKTTAFVVRNLMMWAVPCFVMITGTLLLDAARHVTYTKLFRQYIPRMVAALLLCSIIFELLDTAAAGETIGPSAFVTGLRNAVTGQGWKHLWYLYLMIGLYLLMPFYRKIAASLNQKDTYYLVGIYLLFLSVLPILETMTSTKSAFYICVYSVYPLYLFLGYAISQKLLSCPRWVWAVLAVIGTAAMAVLTVIHEQSKSAVLTSLLENYSSPLIVLQATGIYGLMADKSAKTPAWLGFILRQVDQCSFGIYLLHMVFLKVIMVYCKWNPYAHGGTVMVFLLTLAAIAITFACVWILKKIPGLKHLL